MRFLTSLFRTDEAIGWYEPGSDYNDEALMEVDLVSFGPSPLSGSVSDSIRKKQLADPIKYDSPIY